MALSASDGACRSGRCHAAPTEDCHSTTTAARVTSSSSPARRSWCRRTSRPPTTPRRSTGRSATDRARRAGSHGSRNARSRPPARRTGWCGQGTAESGITADRRRRGSSIRRTLGGCSPGSWTGRRMTGATCSRSSMPPRIWTTSMSTIVPSRTGRCRTAEWRSPTIVTPSACGTATSRWRSRRCFRRRPR